MKDKSAWRTLAHRGARAAQAKLMSRAVSDASCKQKRWPPVSQHGQIQGQRALFAHTHILMHATRWVHASSSVHVAFRRAVVKYLPCVRTARLSALVRVHRALRAGARTPDNSSAAPRPVARCLGAVTALARRFAASSLPVAVVWSELDDARGSNCEGTGCLG